MNEKYFPQYKAFINRDDLTVQFHRLFKDIRDIMCDDPRPEWSPADEFLIQIVGYKAWTETSSGDGYTWTKQHADKVGEFNLCVHGKDIANRIWLAAKKGATFAQMKAMAESIKAA